MQKQGKLFIISAPSGAGKTTLVNALISRMLERDIPFQKVITTTTRPPRDGERDAVDYYFFSQEEFDTAREDGLFLETTEYNNFEYGSPAFIVEEIKDGTSFVMTTDIPGMQKIKTLLPYAICIWITVPDRATLELRHKKRGTPHEKMQERLELARAEMARVDELSIIDHVVVNDDLQTAAHELESIVLESLNS